MHNVPKILKRGLASATLIASGLTLIPITSGCRATAHGAASNPAGASPSEAAKKAEYHRVHYEGKVSYVDKGDHAKCHLYVYTSIKDGKVAAVKLTGLTRDLEPMIYKVGGPVEENKDRLDYKIDLDRTEYKDIAIEGYTRIARSEETEKGTLTTKKLILVDIAVRDEKKDFIGSVVGTEVYKTKILGGITTDDVSRERQTVTCLGVAKADESDVEELPKI